MELTISTCTKETTICHIMHHMFLFSLNIKHHMICKHIIENCYQITLSCCVSWLKGCNRLHLKNDVMKMNVSPRTVGDKIRGNKEFIWVCIYIYSYVCTYTHAYTYIHICVFMLDEWGATRPSSHIF